ncbi:MAG: hypothetical protein K6E19_02935 [Lachnospiraceae bacterium]|nr:hypothetical protein [Lachnospiraceae bacterium]
MIAKRETACFFVFKIIFGVKDDLDTASSAVQDMIKESEVEEGKGNIQKLEEAIEAAVTAGGNIDTILANVTLPTESIERRFEFDTVDTDKVDPVAGEPEHWVDADGNRPPEGWVVFNVNQNDPSSGKIAFDPTTEAVDPNVGLFNSSNKTLKVQGGKNATITTTVTYSRVNDSSIREFSVKDGKYTRIDWAMCVTESVSFTCTPNSGVELEQAMEDAFAAIEKIKKEYKEDEYTNPMAKFEYKDGKWFYNITWTQKPDKIDKKEIRKDIKKASFTAKKYETFVPAKSGNPGVNAYTDQVGIKWDTDEKSITESAYLTGQVKYNDGHYGARNVDDYNYIKLPEKLKAYQEQKDQCDAAVAAVADAQAKVDILNTQIANLKRFVPDTSKLTYLYEQYQAAEAALEDAIGTRDFLQEEVDKARAALDGIKIPNPSGSGPDDPEGDDDDPADEGSGTEPGDGTYVVPTGTDTPVIPVLPVGTTPSGVAGVRTGRRTVARSGAVADLGVLGVKAEATDKTQKKVVAEDKKDTVKKTADNDSDKKLVKVEKNEVPLAATPFEEGMNLNYLWLLLGAAAIIAGVVAYENHKKKVAANDESRKYKK